MDQYRDYTDGKTNRFAIIIASAIRQVFPSLRVNWDHLRECSFYFALTYITERFKLSIIISEHFGEVILYSFLVPATWKYIPKGLNHI